MYNPSIHKEIDTDIDVEIKDLDLQEGQTNYSKKIMNIFNGYQNLITNKISNMKKQFLTPLISATERVVDMVLAVSNLSLNLFLLQFDNKDIENQINKQNSTDEEKKKIINNIFENSKKLIDINGIKEEANNFFNSKIKHYLLDNKSKSKEIKDDDKTETDSSRRSSSSDIKSIKQESANVYSKRLLCEIFKTDYNQVQMQCIVEMADKFDKMIDIILNKFNNNHHFIQEFICYIVEINNNIINLHPDYANFKEETNLRFIVTAKNIYNFAIELFYALHDLYNVRI